MLVARSGAGFVMMIKVDRGVTKSRLVFFVNPRVVDRCCPKFGVFVLMVYHNINVETRQCHVSTK